MMRTVKSMIDALRQFDENDLCYACEESALLSLRTWSGIIVLAPDKIEKGCIHACGKDYLEDTVEMKPMEEKP